MPQAPDTRVIGGAVETGVAGSPQAQFQTRGGFKTALNLTAAAVLKVGAGRLEKVIVNGQGTASAFTLNDSATVAGAAAANVLAVIPFGKAVGSAIDLDLPFTNGLVLSAVPTGGTPSLAASFR